MAGKKSSQKTEVKQNIAGSKKKGGCIWKVLMVIGVINLSTFCILAGGILLDGRDAVVNWGEIGPFLVISLVLGGVLVFFASRHVDFGSDKQTAKSSVNAKPTGTPAKQAPAAGPKLRFSSGDILCMAVVYEGHLPQGHILNQRTLAEEIIEFAHQSGLPMQIQLAPDTRIQVKRANESAYYTGDYEPKDDLTPMMDRMVNSLRGRVNAGGQTSGLLNTKQMVFKSRSNLVSTGWVSLMVMQ